MLPYARLQEERISMTLKLNAQTLSRIPSEISPSQPHEQWVWVLGKRNITRPDYSEVRLADDWPEKMASLIRYPWMPPVLGRHHEVDVEHDQQRAPEIGVVREWKVLTREEAAARGINQVDEEALYARITQYQGPPILYVSPGIYEQFLAEDGSTYPFVIQHIAVVGQPQQQLGQMPQIDLVGIHLRREGHDMPDIDASILEDAIESAEQVDEVAVEVEDVVETLRAQIADLLAEVASLKGELEDLRSSAPVGEEEVEELRRELQSHRTLFKRVLEQDVARADAEVTALARSLKLDKALVESIRQKLTVPQWNEFKRSKAAAASQVDAQPTERKSAKASLNRPKGEISEDDIIQFAREKGVSYSQAYRTLGGK